jgi:biopolymer transport protein ExbD
VREREQKLYGKKENEPFKSHVVIQADKATDFQLVRKTIYSVNQAGWVHINFAVVGVGTGAEGEEGAAEGAEG